MGRRRLGYMAAPTHTHTVTEPLGDGTFEPRNLSALALELYGRGVRERGLLLPHLLDGDFEFGQFFLREVPLEDEHPIRGTDEVVGTVGDLDNGDHGSPLPLLVPRCEVEGERGSEEHPDDGGNDGHFSPSLSERATNAEHTKHDRRERIEHDVIERAPITSSARATIARASMVKGRTARAFNPRAVRVHRRAATVDHSRDLRSCGRTTRDEVRANVFGLIGRYNPRRALCFGRTGERLSEVRANDLAGHAERFGECFRSNRVVRHTHTLSNVRMNTVCIWYGRTHTHMHTITYVFRIVYVRRADNVYALDNTLSHGQTTPPIPRAVPKCLRDHQKT